MQSRKANPEQPGTRRDHQLSHVRTLSFGHVETDRHDGGSLHKLECANPFETVVTNIFWNKDSNERGDTDRVRSDDVRKG